MWGFNDSGIKESVRQQTLTPSLRRQNSPQMRILVGGLVTIPKASGVTTGGGVQGGETKVMVGGGKTQTTARERRMTVIGKEGETTVGGGGTAVAKEVGVTFPVLLGGPFLKSNKILIDHKFG